MPSPICPDCNKSHVSYSDGVQVLNLCPVIVAERCSMPHASSPADLARWSALSAKRAAAAAARERELAAQPQHIQGRTGADCPGCVHAGRVEVSA
jgi:hypothetical protein